MQGIQGLAGSSGSCRVSRFFKADEVPGQAPGGGPISSCVVQTAVSDYSHTVRVPQSRAFLQAVSRPCPKTIKCRELPMSTASVDWGVEVGQSSSSIFDDVKTCALWAPDDRADDSSFFVSVLQSVLYTFIVLWFSQGYWSLTELGHSAADF